MHPRNSRSDRLGLPCSLCGRRAGEVKTVVRIGQESFICDECAERAWWLTREAGWLGFLFRALRRLSETDGYENYRVLEALVPSAVLAMELAAVFRGARPLVYVAILGAAAAVCCLGLLCVYFMLLERRVWLAKGLVVLAWGVAARTLGHPFGWIGSGVVATTAFSILIAAWALERRYSRSEVIAKSLELPDNVQR